MKDLKILETDALWMDSPLTPFNLLEHVCSVVFLSRYVKGVFLFCQIVK